MAIILDADVIIGGEKGTFALKDWLSSRASDKFEIAAMTVAELWHGIERATGAARLRREKYLQTIVTTLPVIPYTQSTAYEHARIWAGLEAAGTMIGYYDIVVAATAMERGKEVATFNKRHFGSVTGLKIIEPKLK